MEKKQSPTLNICWMIPGIVFLCNPEIAGFDILPDFIGYCFLMYGLSCLRDLGTKLNEAFSAFKKLFWISLVQFIAFLYTSSSSVASEQATAYLCITFAVLLFNWIFGIPAWLRFFDGLIYLADIHDSDLDLPTKTKKHVRPGRVSSMRVFTVIFIMVKPLLPFLTESTSLTNDSFLTARRVKMYDFITLFRTLGAFVCLTIGVVWLILMLKLILRTKRDSSLMGTLFSEYQTRILPEKGRFVIRRTNLGFLLLAFAMICSIDFTVDGRAIVPPVISSLLLITYYTIMRPYVKAVFFPFLLSGVHFVSSVWLMYAEKSFSSIKNIYAESYQIAFNKYAVAFGVNRILLALTVVCFVVTVRSLIDCHVGAESNKNRIEDLVLLRRDEKTKYVLLSVLAVIVCCFNFVSVLMTKSHPPMRLIGTFADVLLTVLLRIKTNGTSSLIFNTYAPSISDSSLIKE